MIKQREDMFYDPHLLLHWYLVRKNALNGHDGIPASFGQEKRRKKSNSFLRSTIVLPCHFHTKQVFFIADGRQLELYWLTSGSSSSSAILLDKDNHASLASCRWILFHSISICFFFGCGCWSLLPLLRRMIFCFSQRQFYISVHARIEKWATVNALASDLTGWTHFNAYTQSI